MLLEIFLRLRENWREDSIFLKIKTPELDLRCRGLFIIGKEISLVTRYILQVTHLLFFPL